MLKYLTIATLICLPSFALASNVPFVGKRNFYITPATGDVPPDYYGNGGVLDRDIAISKNGRVKITQTNCAGAYDCNTYVLYQGAYRSVMPLGHGEYVKILNKNQIAYTDKYGNILNQCMHFYSEEDYIEGQPCITDLRRVRK